MFAEQHHFPRYFLLTPTESQKDIKNGAPPYTGEKELITFRIQAHP